MSFLDSLKNVLGWFISDSKTEVATNPKAEDSLTGALERSKPMSTNNVVEVSANVEEVFTIRLLVREFWLPKAGNSTTEYEDALAYSTDNYRFAIADGATESSFAKSWAQWLTSEFVDNPPTKFSPSGIELKDWLKPLGDFWRDSIDWSNLPWYAAEKAKAGAFSALLGLEFLITSDESSSLTSLNSSRLDNLSWKALAVGDSCLYQVRNDELVEKFPISKASQFSNSPLLLSSNFLKNQKVWDEILFTNGHCKAGDMFFLVTDAIAHWFLAQYEAGSKPWAHLSSLRTNEEFVSFVGRLRGEKSIHNDDTTLLTIRIEYGGSPEATGKSKQASISF